MMTISHAYGRASFALLFIFNSLAFGADIKFRQDLVSSIADQVCRQISTEMKDVDIRVDLFNGKKSDARLVDFAQGAALQRRHFGFTFGSCQNSSQKLISFVATMPLPYPLERKYRVPLADFFKRRCKSQKILRHHLSSHKTSKANLKSLFLQPDSTHTIEWVCTPKVPRWSGPRLLALSVPPKVAELFAATKKGYALGTLSSQSELLQFFNAVREEKGLSKLSLDKQLSTLAALVSKNESITHDKRLSEQWLGLPSHKVQVTAIGENKVKFQTYDEAAKLLWVSPAHIDLLLHSNADAIGLHASKTPSGNLLSLVVGKRKSFSIGSINRKEKAL